MDGGRIYNRQAPFTMWFSLGLGGVFGKYQPFYKLKSHTHPEFMSLLSNSQCDGTVGYNTL